MINFSILRKRKISPLPPDEHLKILLVGLPNCGKSSTGNSLFGRKMFETPDNGVSLCAWRCAVRTGPSVVGRQMTVVETPGIQRVGLDHESCLRRTLRSFVDAFTSCCPEGFHAVLFVSSGTQGGNPQEESDAITDVEQLLGDRVFHDHGVVVLTGPGSVLERALAGTKIVQKCRGRFVFFNNRSEDQSVLERQSRMLFRLIMDTVAQHGQMYKAEDFKKAREKWCKVTDKSKIPTVYQGRLRTRPSKKRKCLDLT